MVTNIQIRGKLKYYTKPYGRQWKWRYQVHGRMTEPRLIVPKALEGVKIIDPLQPETIPKPKEEEIPKWIPPRRHPLLEGFFPQLTMRDHPNYHEQAIRRFDSKVKFHAGVDQVCLLTKTKAINSWPNTIDLKLADQLADSKQDELIKSYIRQSLAFDANKERCEGYRPINDVKFRLRAEYATPYKRKMKILVDNLLRLGMSKLFGKYPNTIVDRFEYSNCAQLAMLTRGDDLIQIDGNHDLVITSKSRLPSIATDTDIEQTREHSFIDMYPIFPTVDLKEENIYDPKNPFISGVIEPKSNHIHTFVNLNDDEFTSEQDLTRLMMFAFGTAYGQYLAQNSTVDSDGRLKSPIVVNGVSVQNQRFNFVTYQLNTVNLVNNHGVKNICYYDNAEAENQIYTNFLSKQKLPYQSHRNLQRLAIDHLEYNPIVFKKLLALLLFNASGAAPEAPDSAKTTNQATKQTRS